jgi:hypothetical protein
MSRTVDPRPCECACHVPTPPFDTPSGPVRLLTAASPDPDRLRQLRDILAPLTRPHPNPYLPYATVPRDEFTEYLTLTEPCTPDLVWRAGRVEVQWNEGRRATLVSPDVVDGWAEQVNALRALVGEAIDAGAEDDAEAIARIRRQAGLDGAR